MNESDNFFSSDGMYSNFSLLFFSTSNVVPFNTLVFNSIANVFIALSRCSLFSSLTIWSRTSLNGNTPSNEIESRVKTAK